MNGYGCYDDGGRLDILPPDFNGASADTSTVDLINIGGMDPQRMAITLANRTVDFATKIPPLMEEQGISCKVVTSYRGDRPPVITFERAGNKNYYAFMPGFVQVYNPHIVFATPELVAVISMESVDNRGQPLHSPGAVDPLMVDMTAQEGWTTLLPNAQRNISQIRVMPPYQFVARMNEIMDSYRTGPSRQA